MANPNLYCLARVSVPATWGAYRIHQHLWRGFERAVGAPQPFTFRRLATSHQETPGHVTVLLQSEDAPQLEPLGLRPEDVRQVVLPSVGQAVAFGTRVQAIVRSSGKAAGTKPGQRTINDPKIRNEWLMDRLARAGLAVDSFWSRQDAVRESLKGHVVITEATWMEGHAVVQDAMALREAVLRGVGRGRSLGFGLLSLAKA